MSPRRRGGLGLVAEVGDPEVTAQALAKASAPLRLRLEVGERRIELGAPIRMRHTTRRAWSRCEARVFDA
ncbi:hypothetical protein [Streptomyces sp. AC555_RSS877]|uniref:hypothetical protein n=1 Tax=Streptomyces sp. AC555_RSS877 TaxID=2823688 RepID=UPI001C25C874|nr:hypothetical protein [Streptomyces sp. AC555_RSS877]